MRAYRSIPQVVACFLLTGCLAGRLSRAMQSWEGHHYSEVIMSWGPPQGVYDDGNGGRILVYTEARRWTTPGRATTNVDATATVYDDMIWAHARANTEYVPPQTYGYTAWRIFRIDRRGIIYAWSWRGL
jgi:hypothetical protein